jgi:hypothetical protein
VAELSRLVRTVRAWEVEILAWHAADGCSNGPTEAINLLVKKVKRAGHGIRNFANYRLRLLLHCGVRRRWAWRLLRCLVVRGRERLWLSREVLSGRWARLRRLSRPSVGRVGLRTPWSEAVWWARQGLNL